MWAIATVHKMMVERGAPDGQQMSVNRLSRKPAVNKKIILYIVDRLGLSLFECRQHMAKNKSWRLRSSIRNGLANSRNNLFHRLPVLHGQIAGQGLFDRNPNVIR